MLPKVACAAKPEQTYALYLPTSFTADRIWPVIFGLDPAARGAMPVEMLKEAAEKYGYIVAGSNNSRNGPFTEQFEAAAAVAEDVSRRFPVDGKRVYFTGFSGGARASVYVAKFCRGCAAGVILHGAGFPWDYPPDKEVGFAVYSAVGSVDFNYSEVVQLQDKFDQLGITHRLRRFEGPHRWAPAEVWMEAVEWIELMAMKQGRRERDDAFVAALLTARMERAKNREAASDLFAAWQEYRDAAHDFTGLADVAAAAEKAQALGNSKGVRDALRDEQREFEEERVILTGFENAFSRLLNLPSERINARGEVEAEVESLRKRREQDKEGWRARVAQRSLTQVLARLYESGEQALRDKDHELAVMEFELWSKGIPGQPVPFYQIARTYALAGKKKDALKALREALKLGFSRPGWLESEDFASLKDDAEFQRIKESARKNAPASPQ